MFPFILLALGLILIFLEFYIPGAIMAILGTLLVIASILVFTSESNSPVAILLFTAGVIICLILLIRFTLKRIPKSKSEYSIYLHKDQEGYKASYIDKSLIGKEGRVISDLKPGGYISVDGKRYQAISQTGYISEGEQVLIIGGQEESFIVKKKG